MTVSILLAIAAGTFGLLWLKTRWRLAQANERLRHFTTPRKAMLVFGRWQEEGAAGNSERTVRETHSLAHGSTLYQICGGRVELADGRIIDLEQAPANLPSLIEAKIFGGAYRMIRFVSGFPMPFD